MGEEEISKTAETLRLIDELDQEQQRIVKDYIHELEQKKIEELRIQLGVRPNPKL